MPCALSGGGLGRAAAFTRRPKLVAITLALTRLKFSQARPTLPLMLLYLLSCTCWDLLGAVMQAWEGQCGQLDQYGMKLTRLFANLCNAGVQPQQLTHSLAGGPCRSNLP